MRFTHLRLALPLLGFHPSTAQDVNLEESKFSGLKSNLKQAVPDRSQGEHPLTKNLAFAGRTPVESKMYSFNLKANTRRPNEASFRRANTHWNEAKTKKYNFARKINIQH